MEGQIFQLSAIDWLAWLGKAVQDSNRVVVRMQPPSIRKLLLSYEYNDSKDRSLCDLGLHQDLWWHLFNMSVMPHTLSFLIDVFDDVTLQASYPVFHHLQPCLFLLFLFLPLAGSLLELAMKFVIISRIIVMFVGGCRHLLDHASFASDRFIVTVHILFPYLSFLFITVSVIVLSRGPLPFVPLLLVRVPQLRPAAILASSLTIIIHMPSLLSRLLPLDKLFFILLLLPFIGFF